MAPPGAASRVVSGKVILSATYGAPVCRVGKGPLARLRSAVADAMGRFAENRPVDVVAVTGKCDVGPSSRFCVLASWPSGATGAR
eukprot:7772696-Alexandrium_andersonii.AAC.1